MLTIRGLTLEYGFILNSVTGSASRPHKAAWTLCFNLLHRFSQSLALLLLVVQILLHVPTAQAGNCAHVSFNLTIVITQLQFESKIATKTCRELCEVEIRELTETIGEGKRQHLSTVKEKLENPKDHRFIDVCSVTNRLCHGKHWIATTGFQALAEIGPASVSRSCPAPLGGTSSCALSDSQKELISCACGVTLHLNTVRLGSWKIPKGLIAYGYQVGHQYFNGSHIDCTAVSICHRLSTKYQDLGNWICDDTINHMIIHQKFSCDPKKASKAWHNYQATDACICNTKGRRKDCRKVISTDGVQADSDRACEWVVSLPESIINFARVNEILSTKVTRDALTLIPARIGDAVVAVDLLDHFPLGSHLGQYENIDAELQATQDDFQEIAQIDNLPQSLSQVMHHYARLRPPEDQAGTSQGPVPKKTRHEPQFPDIRTRITAGINMAESEFACQNPVSEVIPTSSIASEFQWVEDHFMSDEWFLL